MSTSSVNAVKPAIKPTKPWAATPKDRAITALSVILGIATSLLVVAVTPMKGKLAYFFVFYISWIIIDSLLMYRKIGKKRCP